MRWLPCKGNPDVIDQKFACRCTLRDTLTYTECMYTMDDGWTFWCPYYNEWAKMPDHAEAEWLKEEE